MHFINYENLNVIRIKTVKLDPQEFYIFFIMLAGRTWLEPEHLVGLYELGRAFSLRGGGEIYRAEAYEEVVEDRH